MTKALITGATGNVGLEVLRALKEMDHSLDLYAGLRSVESEEHTLAPFRVKLTRFDFTDPATYLPALEGCEVLFLLRPPQISAVEKYFNPILDACLVTGVRHIIFLSVQGVENSRIIPHHQIEKLILESKIPYTFLRPAYFMQNFTTTLRRDLIEKKRIFLPAGEAKFTLIDVRDIGQVAAHILTDLEAHRHTAYELTNGEKRTFSEMAQILSDTLGITIRYSSPNPIRFYLEKRKEKLPPMLILVMIMLHFLPRFQKEPRITDWVEQITGRPPFTFSQFVEDYKNQLRSDAKS